MPRFYFDINDTGRIALDDEGLDFPDIETVRREALKTLGEVARDKLPDGDFREFLMTVRDGEPQPVFIASLSVKMERRA